MATMPVCGVGPPELPCDEPAVAVVAVQTHPDAFHTEAPRSAGVVFLCVNHRGWFPTATGFPDTNLEG